MEYNGHLELIEIIAIKQYTYTTDSKLHKSVK